ncbi:MAG: alanine racemase [Erythrobacter sp.]
MSEDAPRSALKVPPPTLRLRVDTDALAANWRALDALSGSAVAGAAVKADCYGLGADACIPALRDAGCAHFFVAHWSEVPAIAAHVPANQIAVLHGPVTRAEADYAIAIGAVPVINSIEQAKLWCAAGGADCHLMIDTGINRLGIAPAQVSDPAIQALKIDTVMSHLASADQDSAFNAKQLGTFKSAASQVPHKQRSLANSAGIALGHDYAFDLTRPGLALYGGVPRAELSDAIRQVAYVEAAIMQTRVLNAGDRVGYNGAFTATGPMPVATIALGYADGFLRSRGPGAALLYNGVRLPLLGKVSMDMVVVDLSDAPDLQAGDWLDVPFYLAHAAQQTTLTQYELLTTLGARLKA